MADRTDELRQDIDQKREDIGYTVDQIQNRVSPGRITAWTPSDSAVVDRRQGPNLGK